MYVIAMVRKKTRVIFSCLNGYFIHHRCCPFSHGSRRGRSRPEYKLAGVVAVHCKIVQDLSRPLHENGGGDDAAVDAEEEEHDDGEGGGAEERVVPQTRDERDLGRERVAEPEEGPDGDEQGGHGQHEAPRARGGLRARDDLGQAALERLQVLAGNLGVGGAIQLTSEKGTE